MDSKGKNIVDFGSARKNLKKKRKADQRTAKEKQAAVNRAKFGRTKAEKMRDKLRQKRDQDQHEGNKIKPLFPAPGQNPEKEQDPKE